MRVVLAGGGTAGHINPALAIADKIMKNQPDSEILFVGTKNGMESNLVPNAGHKIEFIEVSGLSRKACVKNIGAVIKAAKAYKRCKKLLKDFAPQVVIGTGGYVSGPLVYAASALNIPTLIHEQNVFAGLTSKLLAPRVKTICISFKESEKNFKNAKNIVLTGNPLREALFSLTYDEARKKLLLDEKPFVVAFGGSLGARRLNEAMIQYIKDMPDKSCNILFATGEREYDSVQKALKNVKKSGVKVVKYIHNMDEAMQAADLLVCRAGAITISELNALGKPSVLIPSPNVTDNHQFYNAKALCDNKAAVMIEEADLTDKKFKELIDSILFDKAKLKAMAESSKSMGIKNATDLIYNEIIKII